MTHPTNFILIHVYFGPREGWGAITDGPDVQTISDAADVLLDWTRARAIVTDLTHEGVRVFEIDTGVCMDRTDAVLAECVSRFANYDTRDVPQEWRELAGVAA